jgi:glycosyltransferase involved in cell wall biosynthesis
VTIGIPVYNEEQILVANVDRLIAHMDQLGLPYEIIIGSNGSTDGTVRLGTELQGARPTVTFFHSEARGVGLAFREFIARARYPVLVSLDMDLSVDLGFIEHAIRAGATADIIVGSKKLATQRRALFRKVGSDVFLWFARRCTGLPYDDYSIGAKAYRVAFLRSAVDRVGPGSSYVLDLCVAASRDGRTIVCVPVDCEDRRSSKFNLFNEALYKFRRLASLWAAGVLTPAIGRQGPMPAQRRPRLATRSAGSQVARGRTLHMRRS